MALSTSPLIVFICVLFAHIIADDVDTNYMVGTGIWDVTGPAAEINMMGYAKASQKSTGIHLRQYSRAYVIADKQTKSHVVFVSVDVCMISTIVKMQVAKRLAETYPGLYNETNVAVSSTHTHSAPGGFHEYILLDITSMGFVKQSVDALVEGVFQSVKQAHERLRPANIYVTSGQLLHANINRSPTAYANNPESEKKKYGDHNVEKDMTVVKITDAKNFDVGMISWFPVHCTSMNNTNGLISSDNKGYASHMMEKMMNPGLLPHEVKFVAAFAQANEGDVSPNTEGPHCLDTGKSCDNPTSTCDGRNENCVASGPGKDMFESTKIIGTYQYNRAVSLYKTANQTGLKLSGPIDFRHQFVDMSQYKFKLPSGKQVSTCPAAMGYSFAAGTTDGPGDFDFTQGTNSTNKFWNFVSQFISKPTPEQKKCQHPKPILLNTGQVNFPYAWQPSIVPVQLLRVGQLIITSLPGEFTTMAGRRVRDAVAKVFSEETKDVRVVLAGLSNTYVDYITTFEEYQIQRYEGASTIYGPYSLDAYLDLFTKLAQSMTQGTKLAAGPNPPDLLSKQLSFVLPVVMDSVPFGEKFGQPIKDVKSKYQQGDLVEVTFNSADPRNNLMSMKSFLAVEWQQSDSSWTTVYTDSHWETKFTWLRTESILGRSSAVITWNIPEDEPEGVYRIRHSGYHKPLFSSPQAFTGTSSSFNVVKKVSNRYSAPKSLY